MVTGMMMAPRPMMMMPGMPYQTAMSIPSSLPAMSLGQPPIIKVIRSTVCLIRFFRNPILHSISCYLAVL